MSDGVQTCALPIFDKVLERGDGDVAVGTVRAFEAGVLDIPWSPNRQVQSRILPARDVDGYIRILDPGNVPFPRDVLEIHEERLRRRAERQGVPFDHELAVDSVYEISESLERLMPFGMSTAGSPAHAQSAASPKNDRMDQHVSHG